MFHLELLADIALRDDKNQTGKKRKRETTIFHPYKFPGSSPISKKPGSLRGNLSATDQTEMNLAKLILIAYNYFIYKENITAQEFIVLLNGTRGHSNKLKTFLNKSGLVNSMSSYARKNFQCKVNNTLPINEQLTHLYTPDGYSGYLNIHDLAKIVIFIKNNVKTDRFSESEKAIHDALLAKAHSLLADVLINFASYAQRDNTLDAYVEKCIESHRIDLKQQSKNRGQPGLHIFNCAPVAVTTEAPQDLSSDIPLPFTNRT